MHMHTLQTTLHVPTYKLLPCYEYSYNILLLHMHACLPVTMSITCSYTPTNKRYGDDCTFHLSCLVSNIIFVHMQLPKCIINSHWN